MSELTFDMSITDGLSLDSIRRGETIEHASDERLVELAQRKNADAFGEIVRRWERRVFAVCYGVLGREEDARDAAQETFIAAYKNLGGFRGEARVSSWLHRIAVNQCISKQRRAHTRNEIAALDETHGEADGSSFSAPAAALPSRQTEQTERTEIVRRAVGALPLELRQIVVMKEFEEMTFQEIAETLEIPLSTVKSRLYTALKQLRRRLEKTPLEIV